MCVQATCKVNWIYSTEEGAGNKEDQERLLTEGRISPGKSKVSENSPTKIITVHSFLALYGNKTVLHSKSGSYYSDS